MARTKVDSAVVVLIFSPFGKSIGMGLGCIVGETAVVCPRREASSPVRWYRLWICVVDWGSTNKLLFVLKYWPKAAKLFLCAFASLAEFLILPDILFVHTSLVGKLRDLDE